MSESIEASESTEDPIPLEPQPQIEAEDPAQPIKYLISNPDSIRYLSGLAAAIVWMILVFRNMTPIQPFVDFLEIMVGGVGVMHALSGKNK